MTQQDLGQDILSSGELGTLFDSSPARIVQTSGAAVTGFVLGLFAVLAVPFSLWMTLSAGLAAVALVTSIIGLARASRPDVTGGLRATLGLVLAIGTLALVGLRYLGLDTAFGDGTEATIRDGLEWLNGLLPRP
jgi:hypothetical protein